MIKLILTCLMASMAFFTYAQSLDEIRLSYRDAAQSEEKATAFYEQVKHVTQSSGQPVMVAYKGAGLMLLARYTKLSARGAKVREAATWIDSAVERNPDNAEIRLVRLSVQENLPKIARYNQHIDEDRKFVTDALPNLEDGALRRMITGYFEKFAN